MEDLGDGVGKKTTTNWPYKRPYYFLFLFYESLYLKI